jgi:hypothetical protein
MVKPVFIAIYNTDCHFCNIFKNKYWETLKDKLIHLNKTDIEEITLDGFDIKNKEELLTKYPKDIFNHLYWFPIFLLIPGKIWTQCKTDTNKKLTTVIFNGPIIKGDGLTIPTKHKEIKDITIYKWVIYELNNNKIFEIKKKTKFGYNNIKITGTKLK